jgi:hypothetical protein
MLRERWRSIAVTPRGATPARPLAARAMDGKSIGSGFVRRGVTSCGGDVGIEGGR